MNLKSKSTLFHTIIERVDQQLANIPLNDAEGSPMEDSTDLDMHIDAIKEMKITNAKGDVMGVLISSGKCVYGPDRISYLI